MLEKVKKIIKQELDVNEDEITLQTSITEDLSADSLDAIELIMTLEEEFSVEVSDEEAVNFKTVGDIVNFLESKAK